MTDITTLIRCSVVSKKNQDGFSGMITILEKTTRGTKRLWSHSVGIVRVDQNAAMQDAKAKARMLVDSYPDYLMETA